MKKRIDINCDLGEEAGHDEQIMPFISSANIACGFHAGNADVIRRTIDLCLSHQVNIGAHPSFHDQINFGRTEMHLSSDQLYDLVTAQLTIIDKAASKAGAKMNHVKLHGALYNMASVNASMASTIISAVKDFNPGLILFALSGSILMTECKSQFVNVFNEAFADRTYLDNGQLTPRSMPNALIEDPAKVVAQVMQMILTGTVTSTTGKTISLEVDTICIHGDGTHAAVFAKEIHDALKKEGIEIPK
ncbi:MAG: 5-oxoprolinase subunit PxpA, partial [Saprospiraceae bacterium]